MTPRFIPHPSWHSQPLPRRLRTWACDESWLYGARPPTPLTGYLLGRILTSLPGFLPYRFFSWENRISNMNRPRNFRVYFLLAVLAIAGLVQLLREHRPSFLRPGLRLYADVTTADGSVTVVDLVKLKAFSHIYVGPGLSGMREHPSRAEIFGVSSAGGYVWILNSRANQVTARIPVGPLPYAIDFSLDGSRIFTTSSGS